MIPEWSDILLPEPLPDPWGGYEQSAEIINTGPYEADGQCHVMKWKNTGSRDILITRAYLWMGYVHDCICDAWCKLVRAIDGSPIHIDVWDRYANPSDTHGVWKTCNHVIPHEGRLDLHFFCQGIYQQDPETGQVVYGVQAGVHFAACIDFRWL